VIPKKRACWSFAVLVRPALQLRDAFGLFRHGFFQLQNALLKGFCKTSRTRRISCNNTKPNIGLEKRKLGSLGPPY
jgi:hypothetical protein